MHTLLLTFIWQLMQELGIMLRILCGLLVMYPTLCSFLLLCQFNNQSTHLTYSTHWSSWSMREPHIGEWVEEIFPDRVSSNRCWRSVRQRALWLDGVSIWKSVCRDSSDLSAREYTCTDKKHTSYLEICKDRIISIIIYLKKSPYTLPLK